MFIKKEKKESESGGKHQKQNKEEKMKTGKKIVEESVYIIFSTENVRRCECKYLKGNRGVKKQAFRWLNPT